MRLQEAEMSGYRRFAAKSTMELGGRLTCIVGPNAAGKSSFLDALVHLNDETEFAREERTRAEGGGAMSPSIRARFELDEGDREALASIAAAGEVETLDVFKDDGRGLTFRVNPLPRRDLAPRIRAGRRLVELAKSPRWSQAIDVELAHDPGRPAVAPLLEAAQRACLDEERQDLDQSELEELESLAVRLEEIIGADDHLVKVPKKFHGLAGVLRELATQERIAHPQNQAIDVLAGRVPRFLKFSEAERELNAKYDLEGQPDSAIRNLLELAGSSWEAAQKVASSGDEGRKTVFMEETREALGRQITEAWSQIPLSVRFYLEGSVLSIMMEMQARDYILIDQQSDGLRQFVALRAFVARHQERPPIILIDEAETHLHYDAQADLVDALEEQDDVAKVIYTTHSAGCLPRDLGFGVRGIVPIETDREDGQTLVTDHSRVINGFWFEGHGFSPLLIAMGASAFAFASTQKALMTEGFTDALLLPSLIREATGTERLAYHVVPHFAKANAEEVADFDLIASRLVCVLDGDQGGRDRAQFLEGNGIAAEQIVFIGDDPQSGLSLEDLIDPEVYLAAVDKQLAKTGLVFPADRLPEKGRAVAVREWCAEMIGSDSAPVVVRKAAVIKEVMEQRGTRPLVAVERRDALATLDAAVRERMERATGRHGVRRL